MSKTIDANDNPIEVGSIVLYTFKTMGIICMGVVHHFTPRGISVKLWEGNEDKFVNHFQDALTQGYKIYLTGDVKFDNVVVVDLNTINAMYDHTIVDAFSIEVDKVKNGS